MAKPNFLIEEKLEDGAWLSEILLNLRILNSNN